MENLQKNQCLFVGDVVSDKMDKTIVVRVVRTLKHPVFQKVLKKEKTYKVHDPEGHAKVGDMVEFKSCRPISKTKHMLLVRVVKKSDSAILSSDGVGL